MGARKADGRKSRLCQCDAAEARQQTDGDHDRQGPAGSGVTKNRATNAEGVHGFSHRNSRSSTKEATEQVCQPQTQEKITKNSRKKEIMGGEETMEVACATDKEPGEKQPRKESWLATMGPRNAPFGQSREESAGDDICGESR